MLLEAEPLPLEVAELDSTFAEPLPDPELLALFEREARALGALSFSASSTGSPRATTLSTGRTPRDLSKNSVDAKRRIKLFLKKEVKQCY